MIQLPRRGILAGAGALTAASALRPRRAKAAGSITVWWTQGYYEAEDQALKDAVAAFQQQSGIQVNLQIINAPDLITKMIASMNINDVPDAVQAVTGGTFLLPQAVWQDRIMEISDVAATQEHQFLPAALNSCRYYNNVTKSRGIYAVPVKAATLMEEIWLPLIEEAGFSAGDIPKTQDAFFEFFEKVQDKLRAKGRRIYGLGYSMATKEADSNNLFSSFLIAYGGGGIVTPQGKLAVEDPAVRTAAATALDRLTTAYRKGYVPPGSINWGDPDNNNAFYARQVVMTPNATISIAVAQMEKQEQYYKEIITTGVPYSNEGKPVPSILGATPLFIPKGAKNVDGAKEFIKYFIQPANLDTYLKQARGRWLPVMQSALTTDPYWLDPTDPHRPVAAKYGLQLPTLAPWQTYNPAYAQVASEQIWTQAEANISQKGMTVEQATEEAIGRIKTIFQKFEIA
jgi:multiple sugar transport system substrate-binding protein